MNRTYRQTLEKQVITLNGEDYVPKDSVEEILNEIENELGIVPILLQRLY